MADNATTTGGDVVRTKDRAGVETSVAIIDRSNGTAAENLGLTGTKTLSNVTFDDTTAAELVAANATRKTVLFVNRSGGTVFLGPAGTVTAATGIPLPDGASISDDVSVDAWHAIADAGISGDVRIVEVA